MATCVELMTCLPEKPLEVFNYWLYQYSIPIPVIIGLMLGMIIGAIYVRTKSLAHLAVMAIYSISVFGAMLVSDAYVETQYHIVVYIIAIVIATLMTMMVLKLVKE